MGFVSFSYFTPDCEREESRGGGGGGGGGIRQLFS